MDDDAEIIAEFLVESYENLDQLDQDLVELEKDPTSRELLSRVFRTIHTIKGTSGFLAFGQLESLTHVGEHLLAKLRDGKLEMTPQVATALLTMTTAVRGLLGHIESTATDQGSSVDVPSVVDLLTQQLEPAPVAVVEEQPREETPEIEVETVSEESFVEIEEPTTPTPVSVPAPVEPVAAPEESAVSLTASSSVRVDVALLDSLMQMVGELVLTRNQIVQHSSETANAELLRATQRLNLVASELQESVMKTRMQPIGQLWSKMPRLVRDLGQQLGRDVSLQMEGHETELDRTLLEALRDPLTHMVRNSIDHGIEPPAQREAKGKAPQGTLLLRAYHESGQVVIEITDDGAGIDPAKIAAKAIEKGLLTAAEAAALDERKTLALIFTPGFSTAASVSNVSGRGVGMDVVRTNVEKIGGTIDLFSTPDAGTTCKIRIPLTLAIIPALVVRQGDAHFSIPQVNLVELVRVDCTEGSKDIETVLGSPVLPLRGKLLPLMDLGTLLQGDSPTSRRAWTTDRKEATVVVVQADATRFGIAVDEVQDTQEIVVKPLGRQLKSIELYAGATVMGDGSVSLILDVPGIAKASELVADSPDQIGDNTNQETTPTSSFLIAEVSHGRRAAIDLEWVTRLEEFPVTALEKTGNLDVVQYREGILPLVYLDQAIGLPRGQQATEILSVIVHELENQRVGVVIERVVDIAEISQSLSTAGSRNGVKGTAVIDEKVTDIVDIANVAGAACGKERPL